MILGLPFLLTSVKGYASRAFEFTRQFLFKWTVNWRFVGEDRFLSSQFSQALVMGNICILAIFFLTRWTRPSGLTLPGLIRRLFQPTNESAERSMSLRITPAFILTTVFSSVAIGMLCARSLHYQFYTYIAWITPALLWQTNLHPILIYTVWAMQEWAWNVYPSTDTSSKTVVGCLALQVLGVWWGTRNEYLDTKQPPGKVHDH